MRLLEFYNKVDNSVGVAKILFNFLSNKYPSKKIRDIAKTTSGGTPNRSISIYYGGNIPWVKSGELNDGLIIKSEETITEDALKNSSAKIYPKGTLVLALYGATVGKTGILGFESASNQAVCAVYPEKGISKEYLFWFFRQKRFEYIQQSFGGAQPNISQDVVKNTDIPIPPVEIQESVQKLLFHIEKTKQFMDVKEYSTVLPQLKEFMLVKEGSDSVKSFYAENFDIINNLQKTILSEAIQGKLVPQDPKDEPASELLKKIKKEKDKLIKEGKIKKQKPLTPISEDEIPYELPEGWEWTRLGDLCERIHYGYTASAVHNNSGIKLLRITDIQNGKVDWMEVPSCQIKDSEVDKYLLNENDILIARTGGTIGKTYLVKNLNAKSIFASYLIRAVPLNKVNPEYIKNFFGSALYWEQLFEKSMGTGQPNVNGVALSNLKFPLPPLAEQTRIVEKVDKLMVYCTELEKQIREGQKNSEMLMESVLKEKFKK